MNTFFGLVVGIGFGVSFSHPWYGILLFALGCVGLIRSDVQESIRKQQARRVLK
jgi:hypothetical protein